MDIRAGILVLALFAVIGAYLAIRAAIKSMQVARHLTFHSLRRRHNVHAWQLFFFALTLFACAFWLHLMTLSARC